jgi:fructokinase
MRVVVRYDGSLHRGDVFQRNVTVAFTIGARTVIAGLDHGVAGMRVGGRRRLRIAPHLAYRERGVPGRVPANALVVLDVELIEIRRVVGGVETGGTKVLCAVGTGADDIHAQLRIPTGEPGETLARAVAFFREQATPVAAIGIASFGPIDLDPRSPTFGFITTTPKPGWAHTDVAGPFRAALGVPVGFDTDVNGAALGEHRWGAARDVDPFVYVTVGTGIGGGGVVNGRLLHGLVHPEMGHLRLPHDRGADPFPGSCPYHGDCLDGLASGRALRERWGVPAETLPPEHPAWALEAEYLALGLVSVIGVLSPRRIVIGGGVMQQRQLLPRVRRRAVELLAGYVRAREIVEDIENYIVPPMLGAGAGVFGALALAHDALAAHTSHTSARE